MLRASTRITECTTASSNIKTIIWHEYPTKSKRIINNQIPHSRIVAVLRGVIVNELLKTGWRVHKYTQTCINSSKKWVSVDWRQTESYNKDKGFADQNMQYLQIISKIIDQQISRQQNPKNKA